MTADLKDIIDSLLIRWHRWSANPMLSSDQSMREFDEMVGRLWPSHRVTLIVEARNLACGSAVWSTARVRGGRMARVHARYALAKVLSGAQEKWLGHHVITFNARGNRIGESNPRARLTDHEVDLLREMRDETKPDGSHRYSLGFLALRFKLPKSTVQDICSGRRRAQTPAVVREG